MKTKVQLISNFTRVNGYPLMETTLDDYKCYFLLHTGSSVCYINSSYLIAHKGELGTLAPIEPQILVPGNSEVFGGTICDLTIDSKKLLFAAHVADLDKYFRDTVGTDVKAVGILGTNFFHRYKIHLDFKLDMLYSYGYRPIEER